MSERPIVFFDGVCGLCRRVVRWIIRIDRQHVLDLAPLQGETAKRLLSPGYRELSTVVLWRGSEEEILVKSDAILSILSKLGWPAFVIAVLKICPRRLRDWIYQLVARYRYRLFGKHDTCERPSSEHAHRFLP